MPIHEIKPLKLRYRIVASTRARYYGKEIAFYPFADDVIVIVNTGNPGGEPGEFAEYMRQCLIEWYETDQVELIGGENEHENSDVR